jgi:ficolin
MLNTPEMFVAARRVNGWLIIHEFHYNVAFKWNRTWNEYKVGFGTLGSNYWFGLEKLHTLTTLQPHRVRMEVHKKSQNVTLWLEMNVFAVASESQYYRLTWSGMNGSVELTRPSMNYTDTMTNHNGMPFATYDKDPDRHGCPNYGGGWWFTGNCFIVCLTCTWKCGTIPAYRVTVSGLCGDQSVMMIRPA